MQGMLWGGGGYRRYHGIQIGTSVDNCLITARAISVPLGSALSALFAHNDGETMQSTLAKSGGPGVQVSVMVAAELQDSLLVVMHDLHRLEGLLSHATDNLLVRFGEANDTLTEAVVGDSPELAAVRTALRAAVTELQFQDMASQLIWHTTKVLQGCAFRLAAEAMGEDEEGEQAAPFTDMAPDRPNPVTQSEMEAGSIDLF
jgi:hypothetical protein